MKLNKQQLEYFYRLYDLNPMSVIMARLMGMTNSRNEATFSPYSGGGDGHNHGNVVGS